MRLNKHAIDAVFAAFAMFALLGSSPATATTPHWNGCYVNEYQKEFSRQDLRPFGKPFIEWNDTDFADLRRRLENCIDPYFAVRGRREFYLTSVDNNITNYRAKKRNLIRKAEERDRQQREAQEQVARERDRAEKAKLATERYRAAVRQWLEQITTLGKEAETLPTDPKSITRLDEIAKIIAPIGSVNSMDEFLRSASFSTEQQALDSARENVMTRIRQKREASIKIGLDQERAAFRSRARTEARNRASEIIKLGLTDSYLDAPVVITNPNASEPFIALKEIIALLLAENAGTIRAFQYRNNGDIGIAIKKPGQQSIAYGFRMDGAELFLVRYEERGLHEYLDNPFERAMAEGQLREMVGWPAQWSGKVP